MMASTWKQIRKDFPIAKNYTYLDHAAGGPIARPVLGKIKKHYDSNTTASDFDWMTWIRDRENIRKRIAKFVHAHPDEITFVSGTSDGMNHIADLLSGEGSLLTNTSEFPSSTIPWVWRKSKIVWQKTREGKVDLKETKKLIDLKTKILLSSYVQYSTGFRQDLEALGKMKGNRYLIVNATQGFGALPVDVKKWNADFMVTNSYKWMMAGYGSGILYIKKKWLNKFKPGHVGWRSAVRPEEMNNRKMDLTSRASRYEFGCPNFPGIYAVGAAVDYFTQVGVKRIEKRILELTDFLLEKLDEKSYQVISPREKKHRSGIVVFKVRNAEKVWKKLFAKKIFVSLRGGGIRVAPHFYNTEEEIERLIQGVEGRE